MAQAATEKGGGDSAFPERVRHLGVEAAQRAGEIPASLIKMPRPATEGHPAAPPK